MRKGQQVWKSKIITGSLQFSSLHLCRTIMFLFAGKTEKNEYYIGASYYDEKGTFMNTRFQQVNWSRASSTHSILIPKFL